MATTLGEDLDFLNTTCPTVPPKVTAAAEAGHEYVEDVKAFEESIEKKKQAAEQMLGTIKDLLKGLQEQAEGHDGGLKTAMEDAETALEAAIDALEQGRRDVKQALDQAESALGKLKGTASDVGERAKTAQDEAEAKLSALAKGLRSEEQELTSALEEAIGAAENLEEAIGDTSKALKEPVEKFVQKISGLADGINGEITILGQDLFQDIGSLEGDYSEPVGQLEGLAESLPSNFREFADAASGDLKQVLAEMDEAGRELVSTVAEPQPGWKSSRETLDQEVAEIEQKKAPLPGAVDSVRAAAQETGVTFGVA
jgi:ABC-type transporter Mla subunit MlaD